VHLTIPTDNPWVPLRNLGLGKQAEERVEADVFLLTDSKPRILPGSRSGLQRTYSAEASDVLLSDLRSDQGMGWVPQSAWLTKMSIDARVGSLKYDLAVDADGDQRPSPVAAGLEPVSVPASDIKDEGDLARTLIVFGLVAGGVLIVGIALAKTRPSSWNRK